MQNSFIFALPYFAQFLMTITVGQMIDRIRARKLFSITILRKPQAITGKIIFLLITEKLVALF